MLMNVLNAMLIAFFTFLLDYNLNSVIKIDCTIISE